MAIFAISGAAGYVGQALTKRLLSQGHTVRAFIRSGTTAAGAHTFRGDLQQSEHVEHWLQSADVIIHCAGYTGEGDTARATADNVHATTTLAQAAQPHQRIVFLSSVAVYGKHAQCNTPETAPLRAGTSVYATSKIRAERALQDASNNVTILRPGLIWGGEEKRIVQPIRELLKRRLCILPGACSTAVPFTHIDNLIDAIMLAGASSYTGTFNITDGVETSFAEFCERLAAHTGSPPPLTGVSTSVVRWSVRALGRLPSPLAGRLRTDLLMLLNTECSYDISRAIDVLKYRPVPREHLIAWEN